MRREIRAAITKNLLEKLRNNVVGEQKFLGRDCDAPTARTAPAFVKVFDVRIAAGGTFGAFGAFDVFRTFDVWILAGEAFDVWIVAVQAVGAVGVRIVAGGAFEVFGMRIVAVKVIGEVNARIVAVEAVDAFRTVGAFGVFGVQKLCDGGEGSIRTGSK